MIDGERYTLLEQHYDMPEGTVLFWQRFNPQTQEAIMSLDRAGTELRNIPLFKLQVQIH